jgi:hypothetical protein
MESRSIKLSVSMRRNQGDFRCFQSRLRTGVDDEGGGDEEAASRAAVAVKAAKVVEAAAEEGSMEVAVMAVEETVAEELGVVDRVAVATVEEGKVAGS